MQFTYALTIAGVLMAAGAPALAQAPPTAPPVGPVTAPQTQAPPVVAPDPPVPVPAPPSTPPMTDLEVRSRRNAITMMESVLAGAVRLGATATARELQAVQPGLTMFTTSVARAKGIYLEGYGVVFQVEIPGVRPSVVSMIETLARDRRVREGSTLAATAGDAGTPDILMDPDAAYVESVKAALIDAMLDYSKALSLRGGEWLAVAARGDDVPLMPGEIFESRPMILRIRGNDLAEFLANRLTREEVRGRVQVREF